MEFVRSSFSLISSGGSGRRGYTFLTNHLASHGYIVAGLNHSELVAPELARRQDENPEERAVRAEAAIASRVPDIRVLLDHVLTGARLEPAPVGIVGHSFGGWTALASPDVLHQIRAVVALARRKFESEARDSAGEAGVQVGP